MILLAGALLAAAAATPSGDVDRVVADYLKARGGIERIRAIETLRQKGRVVAEPGREALVMRELKRPGKIRFEFTTQGVTGVYVADGAEGWQVSPFDDILKPQPLAEEFIRDASEQSDFEGPLVGWKAKGNEVLLVGRGPVDGRDAYKLEVTTKDGAVRYDFIDVKSHAHVKTESTRVVRGQPVKIETSFRDHKKSGGVLFPRTIEVRAAGRPQVLRIVVDSVEVNPPLPDARFAKPAE